MQMTALMNRHPMRNYQRKLVNELAQVYQSNDPLKWVYIAHKFGIDRPMTNREARIAHKRMIRSFKRMGIAAADAFRNMSKVITRVAGSISDMAESIKRSQALSLGLEPQIDISKQMMLHRLYDPKVIMPPEPKILGNMPDMQIIVDEAMHLDDETIAKLEPLTKRNTFDKIEP
jgi:hypothetical protein